MENDLRADLPASRDIANMSFFPQNISAYFKRPSKIRKSNSRTQSPRTGGRRRMTSQLPTRTRSVIDHQRSSANFVDQMYQHTTHTRPLSWHPNFAIDYQSYQSFDPQFFQQPYQTSANTVFAHGLVTPVPFTAMDESYLDCPAIPLDQMTGQDVSFVPTDQRYTSFDPQDFEPHAVTYTPLSVPMMEAMDYQVQDMTWPLLPTSTVANIATAPASPEFLAMPDMGHSLSDAQIEDTNDKEELIGMGLYDSPAQVQSASFLFSGSTPVRRKSLKLEESFQPAPPSDADADADAEADDDEDADAEDEPVLETEVSSPTQHLEHGSMVSRITQVYDDSLYYDPIQSHCVPLYSNHNPVVSEPAYGWI